VGHSQLTAGRNFSVHFADKRQKYFMKLAEPTVFVIDDDESIREALKDLLESVGLRVETFASAPEFLQSRHSDVPSCLVLDIRMPGLSGLDLQREMAEANIHTPIIFITGHGDIPMSVQAMKGGALEFLTKPFRDQDLLDAIQLGLARDRARREHEIGLGVLRERFELLTSRERDVMAEVVKGHMNKQIAGNMGISEITVKVHRGQVMRKMQAASVPDLARMADALSTVDAMQVHGGWVDTMRQTLHAGLLALEGRTDEAATGYLAAARRWRELEVWFELALSQYDFAATIGTKHPDARAAAEEARQIFTRLGAKPMLQRLEKMGLG